MGLSKKQLEVAKLIAEGYSSQRDIAKKFNISEVTISRWKQQDEFKQAIKVFENEILQDMKRKLIGMTPKAIRELDKLLEADAESVRLQAVKDVLDRVDLRPADKLSITGDVGVTIIDDIPESIKE
ncbi:Bacterial regulatory protein, luxR family [Caloramator mitchellensis]|uniref:Bacterial regulatory protein, luxR family n=2 Tax=Caloramator mitchellensis TaxID=908809 RepID=A0A0R3JZ89_CALMK|nr:Bacterial regulatory protein, luxR family [Caloramator mitchellensis]